MRDQPEDARRAVPTERRLAAVAVWAPSVEQFNQRLATTLRELYEGGFDVADVKFAAASDGVGALVLFRPLPVPPGTWT